MLENDTVQDARNELLHVFNSYEEVNNGLIDLDTDSPLKPEIFDEMNAEQGVPATNHEGVVTPLEARTNEPELVETLEIDALPYIDAIGKRLEYERLLASTALTADQSQYGLAA